MEEITKRYFLLINDKHFQFDPETTACNPLTKDEFSHVFDGSKDRLTILPVIKTDHCPGCEKPDSERAKEKGGGIPERWESEDQYLKYIYTESDPKLRIKAKAVFDKQYRA